MAQKKQRKMVALKVLETSGVDHPAHLEEGWIVMKATNAEENGMPEEELEEVTEEVTEDATEVEVNDDLIERVVELESALSKEREKTAALSAELAKAKEVVKSAEDVEDVLKSVPAPVREMLAKAQADATAAQEELRKEREAQRDREYVAKAAAWDRLAVEADTFGPALRQIADINPSLADAVSKALDAANAQQEAAAIFSEIGGAGRHETGNAFGQVASLAKAAVEKGEYKTVEQAISGLVAANPALYEQYRAEVNG
jgi:hypothetical protein